MDPGDSHLTLARHLMDLIQSSLRRQPVTNRIEHQIAVCNRLIEVLAEHDLSIHSDLAGLPKDVTQLLAISDKPDPIPRPDTPLASTSLLTGTRIDPSLISQLKRELESADRVDILCSFIKWGGINLLIDALKTFSERPGTRLRVITTSYMGATDAAAVAALAELSNAEVRVSYDTHRTRLHAKAYIFARDTGFSSAYIGSANMSRPALTEGLEWTIKLTEYADGPVWKKVLGTFDTYWEDREFELFNEVKLNAALSMQRGATAAGSLIPAFDLRPFQFQEEILETLALERSANAPPHRQLVVAATGTGKTMIAAFDYRRQVAAAGGRYPTLLFVAHRKEILEQSINTFRAVLRDQNFGDVLDGKNKPSQQSHLFATIQTIHSGGLLETLPKNFYAYVVIDETHRSTATSYQGLLDNLVPEILLGLTATPERTDGNDILKFFNQRISAEIRLPDAITRRLVVPFHYFGVSDSADIDYSQLRWERGGYRTVDLDNLVTGNEVRAGLVIDQCNKRLGNPLLARGLGFCVSVQHAQFMAGVFNKAGIPSMALSAMSQTAERDSAKQRLRSREINFIFVVDLYNEGVDIPEVDALLFLRPTESLTVFLQQLGRGLRLTEDKDYVTVLDFIGQMHQNFRFDQRLRALLTDPSKKLEREINHDFPHLPAGCSMQLERVARERVLQNIRQALVNNRSRIAREIAVFTTTSGLELNLANFLAFHDLSADDIYRRACWSRLCVQAGVLEDFEQPDEKQLTRWLRRLAHADDIARIDAWLHYLTTGEALEPYTLQLAASLFGRVSPMQTKQDFQGLLEANPILKQEAIDLLRLRRTSPFRLGNNLTASAKDIPLALYGHFTRDEILAATGAWTWDARKHVREGVCHLPERKADLFFITLNKAEKNYSPSTLYEDYAISESLFHWQSQSTTSAASPTGQRYQRHEKTGNRLLIFVRENIKSASGLTQPYVYLGCGRYLSHTGDKPMNITFKMETPIPARLLRTSRRLVVG